MESCLEDQIVHAAEEVHRQLKGPGLLETVYESALSHELFLRGITTQRQVPIPVTYKNVLVRDPLYLDILVENAIIVEIKATGRDYPFYQAQLFTYLRLFNKRRGLLINFGKQSLKKDGIVFIDNDCVA